MDLQYFDIQLTHLFNQTKYTLFPDMLTSLHFLIPSFPYSCIPPKKSFRDIRAAPERDTDPQDHTPEIIVPGGGGGCYRQFFENLIKYMFV